MRNIQSAAAGQSHTSTIFFSPINGFRGCVCFKGTGKWEASKQPLCMACSHQYMGQTQCMLVKRVLPPSLTNWGFRLGMDSLPFIWKISPLSLLASPYHAPCSSCSAHELMTSESPPVYCQWIQLTFWVGRCCFKTALPDTVGRGWASPLFSVRSFWSNVGLPPIPTL